MFLQKLKLRNIRSLREVELDFASDVGLAARQWTFLLGENGTGKSSVLRALALAIAGSEAVNELVGNPDDWIRLGANEASIEVQFTTSDNQPRRAALNFQRGWNTIDLVENNRADLSQIDSAVAKSERNYFIVGYGVTRRPQGGGTSFAVPGANFRTRRARAMATLFSGDASLVALEHWAMDLDYRRGGQGLNAVRTALDKLLPDVSFKHIDRERRQLIFDTLDGELPFSALSDGYQAMAAWCGDLLWQITESFEDYSDPLRARGLLLVDEIDLHLHPVWQRRLVSFLKETLPNVQVVVTTHSPLTVHQAGENELFVLRRDDGEGVAIEGYEGAPNRLLLPQLLASPLFGLQTLDSPQVEQLRDELRDLSLSDGKKQRSAAKQSRIRAIEGELEGVSQWREVPAYLQPTNRLLEEVAAQIGPGTNGTNSLKSLARRVNPDGDESDA
jgi:predicted ATPase